MILKRLNTWIWNDLKSMGFPYIQAVQIHDPVLNTIEVLLVKIPFFTCRIYLGQLLKESQ